MDCYSRKTDGKIESYSKKTNERMNDFSRKADELMERFMLVTNTLGNQIQGMNSSIAKMQETNEKIKKKGKTNSINSMKESWIWRERSWAWTKKVSTEAVITNRNMWMGIKEKQ